MEAVQQAAAPPASEVRAAYGRDTERVRLLVDSLSKIPNISTSTPFTVDVWNHVLAEWVQPLLQGKPETIDLPPAPELRHVLNAAWMARIDDKWKPALASKVNALANRVRTSKG